MPDARTIERYQKLARMAAVDSGGTPNEMASARREMEKLDSQYPSLRSITAAGNAAASGAGTPNSDTVYDWLRRADQFVQNLHGAVTARTLALKSTEITARVLSDDRLRFSVTLPANVLEDLIEMHAADRALFAAAVGEMLTKHITDTIRNIDENG
jgi:hypothetical protein